jgi:YbbR domain-containing protein
MTPKTQTAMTATERIKLRLTRNMGLRMLSVAIALGLWMFVNTGEHGAIDQLTVPISYRLLPPAMVIVNRPPDFARIEVTGSRRLLSLIDPERITVKLELRKVALGQNDIKLDASMFDIPRGTSVTQISPSAVTLDVDHIVSREVPVHLVIDGKPVPGHTIASAEVRPSAVTATGPSRFVAPLAQVNSDIFDVSGLAGDAERTIALAELGAPVRLSSMEVDARVNIVEQMADKQIRADIDVVDSRYKFRVEPRTASVTLRGPMLKLQSIDSKGLMFVDAKGLEPGVHEVAVQVRLPDGAQVVDQAPAKVRLRTFHDKLVIDGSEHSS